jgi:hypothetical protein
LALVTINRDAGRNAAALSWADRLATVDPSAKPLVDQLRQLQFSSSVGSGGGELWSVCRASPIGRLQNVPDSNRVLEMVPSQHSRKPLRTLKLQAEY